LQEFALQVFQPRWSSLSLAQQAASCGGLRLPRLSLDCSCPPAHEMLALLARWHGPGRPPGRGAATCPRAPRPGRV